MQYRLLGRTGVQVSPLCLGAMMFGPWGNDDRADAVRIIRSGSEGAHKLDRAWIETSLATTVARYRRHRARSRVSFSSASSSVIDATM